MMTTSRDTASRWDTQTVVWLVLLAATIATAVVGLEQAGPSGALAILLLAIAFFKLRLVGIHFMELKDAPAGLRLAFEAYAVVGFAVLVALYLAV